MMEETKETKENADLLLSLSTKLLGVAAIILVPGKHLNEVNITLVGTLIDKGIALRMAYAAVTGATDGK